MNKIGQKLFLATALSTATGACDQIQEHANQQIRTIQQSVTESIVEPISQTVDRQVVPATFRCTEIPGARSTDSVDIIFDGAVNTGQIYTSDGTRGIRTNQPFRGAAMDLSDSMPIDFRQELRDSVGNPTGATTPTGGVLSVKHGDMYYSFVGGGLYAAHTSDSATLRVTPENFGSITALTTTESQTPAAYLVDRTPTQERLYEQRINTETHQLESATLIGSMEFISVERPIGCLSMTYVDTNPDTTFSSPIAIDSVVCTNTGTGYEMLTIKYNATTNQVLDNHLQITSSNSNWVLSNWHPDFRSNIVGEALQREDTDHLSSLPGAFRSRESGSYNWYLLDQCNVDTTEIATTICPPSSEVTCLDTLDAPSSTTGFCEDRELPVCLIEVIVEPDAGDSDVDPDPADTGVDSSDDTDATPEVGDTSETDGETDSEIDGGTDAEEDTSSQDANDASETDGETGDSGNPEVGDATETDSETDAEEDTSNPDANPDSSNDTGRTDTGNPEVGHDASETDGETNNDTGGPDTSAPDTPPTPPRPRDEGCSTQGGTPAAPGAALIGLLAAIGIRRKRK